jgi:hypothetical protein
MNPSWTAWTPDDDGAARIADSLRPLTGRRISRVRFIDLEYESDRPYWHVGDHVLLDHGLELDLDDGSTWSLIWEQAGTSEGLGIYPEPLLPNHLMAGRTFETTRYWHRRGPRDIVSVELGWSEGRLYEEAGVQTPDRCLREVVLVGHDREAVIVLGYGLDVLVCWSRADARRAGYLTEHRRHRSTPIR